MAAKPKTKIEKITTPMFRVSFPAIFKAVAYEDQPAKFAVTMLFDNKTADLNGMKAAAMKAAVEKFGPKADWPENFKWPFRDGNKKKDVPGYAGTTYVRATSKQKPGVIDQRKEELTEESNQLYAGCYARAVVTCYAFDRNGGRGVAFGLQHIQKWKDGEEFSGRKKAVEEFDEIADESESPDSYGDSETDSDDLGF